MGEGQIPGRATNNQTETSIELLARAQAGDERALDRLCGRYLPILTRWAQGRIPGRARSVMETDDVVQETMVRTLKALHRFEHRRDGALLAYLRTVLHNRIREEVRRSDRRRDTGAQEEPPRVQETPSPLEALVTRDEGDRYEAALQKLRDIDREAIIARVEMNLPYEQVADLLGKPSIPAARKAVSRAVLRLATVLGEVA